MHDSLGPWPLAITAYNHGPEGLARAADQLGTTDIATIVRDYHGNAFGFASRNFYAEFVSALDVERNWREDFGHPPLEPLTGPAGSRPHPAPRPPTADHLAPTTPA